MNKHCIISVCAAAAAALGASAVEFAPAVNVPPLFKPGEYVEPGNAKQWREGRRAELKKIFEDNVYGRRPVERPPHLKFIPAAEDAEAMDGKAVRKIVRIEYGGAFGTNSFPVVAFIPKSAKSAPSFVLIDNRNPAENIDPERKKKSPFWPAEEIVARGYAAIAFYNGDVAPDMQCGNTRGAFAAFENVEKPYRSRFGWGTLSAWAWAASRVLDWIETEPLLDAKHVAVVGHSRGGKTALVAAAWDERFAMACSNCSGTCGAKLNHMDLPGSEKFANIDMTFQYWFAKSFTAWVNLDASAPFDQHMLLALIAPRLVCIASATKDSWAGPFGEYTAARYASPAWEVVFGRDGFKTDGFPEPGRPQQDGDISYHIREGKHDMTPFDWNVYMDFADRHGWRD